MTDSSFRTGSFEILVPARLGANETRAFIRRAVEEKLFETKEWPVKVSARTGVRHSEGIMSYTATFETGAFGVEFY
ncbi:MAG: hypothetical protein WBA00_17205 [Rhodococcus sp. (in: high G+C Gram-positive bacteria)]